MPRDPLAAEVARITGKSLEAIDDLMHEVKALAFAEYGVVPTAQQISECILELDAVDRVRVELGVEKPAPLAPSPPRAMNRRERRLAKTLGRRQERASAGGRRAG